MGDEVLLVMDFTNFALRHTIYLTNVAAAQLSKGFCGLLARKLAAYESSQLLINRTVCLRYSSFMVRSESRRRLYGIGGQRTERQSLTGEYFYDVGNFYLKSRTSFFLSL